VKKLGKDYQDYEKTILNNEIDGLFLEDCYQTVLNRTSFMIQLDTMSESNLTAMESEKNRRLFKEFKILLENNGLTDRNHQMILFVFWKRAVEDSLIVLTDDRLEMVTHQLENILNLMYIKTANSHQKASYNKTHDSVVNEADDDDKLLLVLEEELIQFLHNDLWQGLRHDNNESPSEDKGFTFEVKKHDESQKAMKDYFM
jgi:hypothetical protein